MRVSRKICDLGRLASQKCLHRKIPLVPRQRWLLTTLSGRSEQPTTVSVHQVKAVRTPPVPAVPGTSKNEEKPKACGDVDENEEMEQEEMFVDPHESFQFRTREWGGPRRGGRLPEPTRYGDWERKGRCSDF